MQFNYSDVFVTISTNNIQLLVKFYSQILQSQPAVYVPSVYAEFRSKQLRLGIFRPKPESQSEFNNHGSSMSLCLEVEQLEQAIACWEKLGYPPPGEIIEASHGKEIYAYDPAGNRLILHQSKSP
jgi:predicted enzyme related to lactoylglutathione lyase